MSDTYESGYAKSRERFERNTAEHKMTILHDDGIYRHLRFQTPGTSFYYYDLVTWPGHLVICGDAGDWHFARLTDMFQFFAGERQAPGINPHYWSEKLQGDRGRDIARCYSEDKLRGCVIDWFEQQTGLQQDGSIASWAFDDEEPDCLADPWTLGSALALSRALDADVLDGGYEHDSSHEQGAQEALRDFEFPNRYDVSCTAPEGCRIYEPWDWDLRDHDPTFLWACWAIVRGIQRYRAAEPAAVAS